MSQLPFRQQLETHNQPEEVRRSLAAGQYGQPHAGIAQEYLDSIDREAAAKAAALRDAREERTLAIAEDALSIAKEANRIASDDLSIAKDSAKSARRNARWAMYAAIIAIVAAAISTKDQIFALIFGNP